MIYRVAIPSPLRRLFDYLPPAHAHAAIKPGTRVRVPFGNRELTGIVVNHHEHSDQPESKLRPLISVIDNEPTLPSGLLELGLWASDYYQFPVGESLTKLLPSRLRKREPLDQKKNEDYWQLTTQGLGLPETALSRARKQQQLLQLLQQHPQLSIVEIEQQGISRSIVRSLHSKGLIEAQARQPNNAKISTFETDNILAEAPLKLHEEQQVALNAIDYHRFQTYLLQGITGSGKTEVYLQAIANVLRYGKQAMVLVPEINLTPQTLARFKSRFNCPLAVIHSGLTDLQRLNAWLQARSGEARIIIGTRSAIFTPMPELGIIIIDEEHDGSYKQQDGFRYSARDVAIVRANKEKIPIILGSATPSLESLHNCHRQRYQLLTLKQRPEGVTQPQWQLVDIKKSQLSAGFSTTVVDAITTELAEQNQVLVFLNRRGYAPLMMCHDCGWTAVCPRCDIRMTTHIKHNRLLCHHCEFQQPIPANCPQCHSPGLQFIGQGTERGESILQELFPDTRILRIDRDTMIRKQAMQNLMDDIAKGLPCILVGTQMLAKGHHFPNVTLAALLDVDGGLFSADFRATEKMGQLITQVAGRAGRGNKQGKVIIQSHQCDHPLLQQLATDDYTTFAQTLLAQRKQTSIPPFSHLSLVRAEATSTQNALHFLHHVRQLCEQLAPASPQLRYLGPLPCVIEKRKDRYRYELSIFADHRGQLQSLLTQLCLALESDKNARKIRWSVDVDPQDML